MKRYTISKLRDEIQAINNGFHHSSIPVKVYVVNYRNGYNVGWENVGKDSIETYNLTTGSARESSLVVNQFFYETCKKFLQKPC